MGAETRVRTDVRLPGALVGFGTAGEDLAPPPVDERTPVLSAAGGGVWLSGRIHYFETDPVVLPLSSETESRSGTARAPVAFRPVLERPMAYPDLVASADGGTSVPAAWLRDEGARLVAKAIGPIQTAFGEILEGLRIEPGRLDVAVHAAACDKPRLLN